MGGHSRICSKQGKMRRHCRELAKGLGMKGRVVSENVRAFSVLFSSRYIHLAHFKQE